MAKKVTEKQVIEALKAATAKAGSIRTYARLNGFDPTDISKVINGRKTIPARLAECLGYDREISFTKKPD